LILRHKNEIKKARQGIGHLTEKSVPKMPTSLSGCIHSHSWIMPEMIARMKLPKTAAPMMRAIGCSVQAAMMLDGSLG
jgi:hypothetical protein